MLQNRNYGASRKEGNKPSGSVYCREIMNSTSNVQPSQKGLYFVDLIRYTLGSSRIKIQGRFASSMSNFPYICFDMCSRWDPFYQDKRCVPFLRQRLERMAVTVEELRTLSERNNISYWPVYSSFNTRNEKTKTRNRHII